MTGQFAAGAVRLAALAGQVLGWSADHFWNATPAELAVVLMPLTPAGTGLSRTELNRLMERDDG